MTLVGLKKDQRGDRLLSHDTPATRHVVHHATGRNPEGRPVRRSRQHRAGGGITVASSLSCRFQCVVSSATVASSQPGRTAGVQRLGRRPSTSWQRSELKADIRGVALDCDAQTPRAMLSCRWRTSPDRRDTRRPGDGRTSLGIQSQMQESIYAASASHRRVPNREHTSKPGRTYQKWTRIWSVPNPSRGRLATSRLPPDIPHLRPPRLPTVLLPRRLPTVLRRRRPVPRRRPTPRRWVPLQERP